MVHWHSIYFNNVTLRGGPMFLMVADNCSMCFSWSKISCIVRDRWDLKLVWAELVSAIRCWNDLKIQNMIKAHRHLFFMPLYLLVSTQCCCMLLCSVLRTSSTFALNLWDRDLAPEMTIVISYVECVMFITLWSLQVVLWEVRPSFRDAESCVNLLDAAVEINSPSAYFKM